MGTAIGQVLSLGGAVALSPVPIIAVVLMLGTPKARSNGPSFLAGWMLGSLVVGAAALAVSDGTGASSLGEQPTWSALLELVLGLAFLLLAGRIWRRRGQRRKDPLPRWMRAIDTFSPVRAAGAAALLSGVNPKNHVLALAAGVVIARTREPAGTQAAALLVFVLIAALGPGVPVVMYFALGQRADRLLAALKSWLAAHSSAIMTVLCLVIAWTLIADALSGLPTDYHGQ